MFFIDEKREGSTRVPFDKYVEYNVNASGYDITSSVLVSLLKKLKPSFNFTVVGEAHRPDLVSYKIYKRVEYWWVVLACNDRTFFEDIYPGDILSLPSMKDIDAVLYKLRSTGIQKGTRVYVGI